MTKKDIVSILSVAIGNSDNKKEQAGLMEARKLIKDLPNAFCNRNVKKAKWIKDQLGYVCPNCESTQIYKSNFCANCGADLR